MLILAHPEVAFRSCEDCERWIYDAETGKKKTRAGRPIARPHISRPPCSTCPKCEGENVKDVDTGKRATLSPKNWQTIQAYFQVQATHLMIDDPITQTNFGTIAYLFSITAHQQRQAALMTGGL